MYESERFPLCCLPSFCAEGAIVMIRVIVPESLMSASACVCRLTLCQCQGGGGGEGSRKVDTMKKIVDSMKKIVDSMKKNSS